MRLESERGCSFICFINRELLIVNKYMHKHARGCVSTIDGNVCGNKIRKNSEGALELIVCRGINLSLVTQA